MSLAVTVKAILERHWCADHAGTLQQQIASDLRYAGFFVTLEFPTRDLGDDRDGRIDIVARHSDGRGVAIELDARKPRRRSIAKLRLFDGVRIIGLRGVQWPQPPEGIDAMACITVVGGARAR